MKITSTASVVAGRSFSQSDMSCQMSDVDSASLLGMLSPTVFSQLCQRTLISYAVYSRSLNPWFIRLDLQINTGIKRCDNQR